MRPFFQSFAIFLRLTVALSLLAHVRSQCYYPGGAWASDQYPCDRNAYTTLCCPTGWTCFSNNLCIATDPSVVSSDLPIGTAIRGTCTDPEWNNAVCGDFCLDDPVSSNNGSVVPCGNNNFCCQPDITDEICDCSSGVGTFQLSNGTAQTIIGVIGLDYTSTGYAIPSSAAQSSSTAVIISTYSTISILTLSTVSTVSVSPSSTLVASSKSSKSSTRSISPSLVSSSLTKQFIPSTTTSPATKASATEQQIFSNSTPVTSSTAFKAGIGTAAGVVIALLIALAIWRYVARKKRRDQAHEAVFGNTLDKTTKWEDPTPSETPFPTSPIPNPYEEPGFTTGGSQGASMTALADQVAHNRRPTPRPRIVFGDLDQESNPYAEGYGIGSTGRR